MTPEQEYKEKTGKDAYWPVRNVLTGHKEYKYDFIQWLKEHNASLTRRLEAEEKWHSVDEPPENEGDILTYGKLCDERSNKIEIHYYVDDFDKTTSHWRSIPESPIIAEEGKR